MNDVKPELFPRKLHDELIERWSEPHRRYHTVEHLNAVLDALTSLERADVSFDSEAVTLAAWFHDAIYDIGSAENEERSATLALEKLEDSLLAEEVARLVRVTADHRVGEGDVNAAALCDADLAVMAGTASQYATYARRVREEYAQVPDDVFAKARADLLEKMLTSDTLFRTSYGRQKWEPRARANVSAEIAQLRASITVDGQ